MQGYLNCLIIVTSLLHGCDRSWSPRMSLIAFFWLRHCSIQDGGGLFDWAFDKAACTWRPWMDPSSALVPIPEATPFNEIIVPTIDTVRYGALLQLLLTHGKHAMVLGPTGTGEPCHIPLQILSPKTTHKSGQAQPTWRVTSC